MNANMLNEASTLLVEKAINERNSEISFFLCDSNLNITDLYNDVLKRNPKLMLCIKSMSATISRGNQGFLYTINVRYTDTYPAFVKVVEEEGQVKKSLLVATMLHRKKEYFVCKKIYLDTILATVESLVSSPEYLNCYLSKVQSSVISRSETNYVGIIVSLGYSCDYHTSQMRKAETNRTIDNIAKRATEYGIEDWKKAYAVILYCVKNWKYSFDDGSGLSYTAYGALVNNKAVCMGFSLALCAVFKKLGIPCKYIHGQRNGEGHAWNMIYIKGGWFYIDVTDAIGRRDPLYRWGTTTFDDNRVIFTDHGEKLSCHCDKEFVLKHCKKND